MKQFLAVYTGSPNKIRSLLKSIKLMESIFKLIGLDKLNKFK
jgi:hypothetical protein